MNSKNKWLPWAGLILIGVGLALILLGWTNARQASIQPQPEPTIAPPTLTPEPLLPTRTPAEAAQVAEPSATPNRTPTSTARPTRTTTATAVQATRTPAPVAATPTSKGEAPPLTPSATPDATPDSTPDFTLTPLPTLLPTATETPAPAQPPSSAGDVTRLWAGRPRWGIGVAQGPLSRYNVGPLRLGWYLTWRTSASPGGLMFAQMIRLGGGALRPNAEEITRIAQANPGALWLVGNEPDVKWQDNVAPATYARLYHDAYAAIKTGDPSAFVAIGGVSQPTPLRMRYLDVILQSYRDQFGAQMPIDVWNVHNFVLREERGSWGVDIPPGMGDNQGMLYEIADSSNLDIFRRQIYDFRRWMAQRGYRDKPLIVSEYGVLMPEDYGFPPDVVASFLIGTFDFFLSAADGGTGYPGDGNRLVQMWCWYSLDDSVDYYPTGNLFDPHTGAMTPVGQAWVDYVQ
jgi:hypothetical protein